MNVSDHVMSDKHSFSLNSRNHSPSVNSVNNDPVCNNTGSGHNLLVTVHQVDALYQDFPGGTPFESTITVHPILADIAFNIPIITALTFIRTS